MVKMALFPVLLAFSCLCAGAYGALHNQVSYTISPDYFHAYKFYQFDIPESLHNRFGAALVGWRASWWMGLVIGVPVLSVALIIPNWKTYLKKSLIAIGVVAVTTIVVGLIGLLYASLTINAASLGPVNYEGIADPVAFERAGTMHDFSYLGGCLGILTAWVYLVVARLRLGTPGGGQRR